MQRKITNKSQESKMKCNFCKKPGHTIKECRCVTCKKCGRRGHMDFDCITEKCYHCDKFGHTAKNCFDLLETCENCGGKGHIKEDCWTKKCSHCEKVGHLVDNCLELSCKKCSKRGHRESYCNATCWYCKKYPDAKKSQNYFETHTAKTCEFLAHQECQLCGEIGHHQSSCENPSIMKNGKGGYVIEFTL